MRRITGSAAILTPMRISSIRAPLAAVLATAVAAVTAGCAALAPDPPDTVEAPELLEPVAFEPRTPLQTRRFELDDPSQRVVGELQVIRTRDDDTFVDIARAYNLGFEELVAANPDVDPWLPGEGAEIVLPTRFILPDAPLEGIVINTAQMRLFWYPEREEGDPVVVYTHPIGIGRIGRETPTGEATVIDKATDPTWYPPASVRREHAEKGDPLPAVVPPGPDNPLGRHVFRLSMPSYLIHGTNKPPGVGMRVSAGCVRMFPEDIEALFPHIGRGTPVHIVNQPLTAGWHGDQLYVDAHPLLEEDDRDAERLIVATVERAMALAGQPLGTVDFSRAAALLEDGQGLALPVLRTSPGAAHHVAAARRIENIIEGHSPVDADELAAEVDGVARAGGSGGHD